MTAVPGPIDPRVAADPAVSGPAPDAAVVAVGPTASAIDAVAVAATPVRYVGLLTRGVAFALDAAIINVVAIFVEVGLALVVSLLHLPHEVRHLLVAVGAAAYVLWTIGYFVGFWSTAGQTPGNRVMQIRVVAVKGERLKPRRAFVRCVGLVLAALPLFAGYLMILFNSRRRGLQDYLARTVVIEAPQLSEAQVLRAKRRTSGPGHAGAGGDGALPPSNSP